MKKFLLYFIVLFPLMSFAKEGKIKYGKDIIYQGEVQNKEPYGTGSLIILEPNAKDKHFAEIKGVFKGLSEVENPQIISSHIPDMSIIGIGSLTIQAEKKQPSAFNLYLKSATARIQNDELRFEGLTIKGETNYYGWNVEFKSEPFGWMKDVWRDTEYLSSLKGLPFGEFIGETTHCNTPQELKDYKWDVSHIIKYLKFDNVYGFDAAHGNKFELSKSTYVLSPTCSYIYEREDNQQPTFLNVATGYKFTINNDGNWNGFRVLDNVIIIRNQEISDAVQINTYPIGQFTDPTSTYNGTIENCNDVINGTFKADDIKYYTGELDENGRALKWANGESEQQLRDRLTSRGVVYEPIVSAVLTGKKTVEQAVLEQQKLDSDKSNATKNNKLPEFTTADEILTFIDYQNENKDFYSQNFNVLKGLCFNDPAEFFYEGDELDKAIYLRSPEYQTDSKYYKTLKTDFFLLELPTGKITVDGGSFSIRILVYGISDRPLSKKNNFISLEIPKKMDIDFEYFRIPVNPAYWKKREYYDGPDLLVFNTNDFNLLKTVRSLAEENKVQLLLLCKPGTSRPGTWYNAQETHGTDFFLKSYGLYLIDKESGNIVADLSKALGAYSEPLINRTTTEQKNNDLQRRNAPSKPSKHGVEAVKCIMCNGTGRRHGYNLPGRKLGRDSWGQDIFECDYCGGKGIRYE